MQSSKLPRKTSKPAESAAPSPTPERTSKPRTSRAKKATAETDAIASAAPKEPEESVMKHHHSLPVAEPANAVGAESALPVAATSQPAPITENHAADVQVTHGLAADNEITHDQIAQLAHSYWADRGYAHGSPEQDWLRAERQLKSRAATA